MIDVTENLRLIIGRIEAACSDANRSSDNVKLLAVSKRQPASAIAELARAGQRDFGENQLQEALDKQAELETLELCWHFIGSIQSNKTRSIAERFTWVHAIDREKIARRLSDQRPDVLPPLNVCIQVNIDDESSKSGVAPRDLPALAASVAGMPRLRLRGLMCLPAIRDTFDEQRVPFRRLRELKDELVAAGLELDTLSMGMTGDFPAAIAEGATIVRVGTALFGERPTDGN